ncbi:putative acetyltransferase EpsM [Sphaerisporangium krabiense]|uniref:Sugar O-acyltransferase (Sialic acid O-acetyltransferase NeuD family) n=1 Tax=Sphaerisporangium krabiense TaxID=763782 RepID=A0A7W8Z0V0_9ACTN|nr:acetyltransferase [Sphaerisporangium krabiense]MBB5625384.1 sugar O-acyltransferase (sialic acid O-acetyltransferase NeuD family) [Sphaerisporangium krabiense]GII64102.1 putative acetyltransferase EpsM [Sphaerisporangium krabiense]
MTPLLLIGAGGLAREVAQLVHAINDASPTWDLLGHLDDDPAKQGALVDGVPVLAGSSEVFERKDARVVICTASPRDTASRARIAARLGLPDERYATLVHPSASVSRSSAIGPGSIVLAQVVMTAAVAVGAHVCVMPHVTLTHDDVVEDHATIASGARFAGGVRVGRGAYIGAGALVRENLTIGRHALVGMGSVVTKNVPAQEVWAGVPAKFIRPATVITEH